MTTPGGAYDMVGAMQVAGPANTNSLSGANFYDLMEQPGTTMIHCSTSGERRGFFTAEIPIY